jgi:hypothetical protein
MANPVPSMNVMVDTITDAVEAAIVRGNAHHPCRRPRSRSHGTEAVAPWMVVVAPLHSPTEATARRRGLPASPMTSTPSHRLRSLQSRRPRRTATPTPMSPPTVARTSVGAPTEPGSSPPWLRGRRFAAPKHPRMGRWGRLAALGRAWLAWLGRVPGWLLGRALGCLPLAGLLCIVCFSFLISISAVI